MDAIERIYREWHERATIASASTGAGFASAPTLIGGNLGGMDEIRHEPAGHKGAIVWRRDGEKLAELTYSVAGSRVILDHTDVDDRLRGQGAGKKLVTAAVEWARKENKKLMPLCPFARSVFDKTPDFADVLAK